MDDDDLEERKDENLAARAILVQIFASDIIPITGDDQEQLSRMYSTTFAISSYTKAENLMMHACKYWGVLQSEYAMWYEDTDAINGISLISENQLTWNVSLILSGATLSRDKNSKAASKAHSIFFIGRFRDSVRAEKKDFSRHVSEVMQRVERH